MFKREKKDEFDQRLLEIARVTRVTKGGKRLSFRAVMIVGNRRGRVGLGVGKGADVSLAIEKAVRDAKKNLINVSIVNDTIAHEVGAKYVASKVFMKPAPRGSGLIAGGVIRSIAELAGIKNISAKSLRSSNKINGARAVMIALQQLRKNVPSTVKQEQKKEPIKKENEKAKPVEAAKKEVKHVKTAKKTTKK